MENNSTPKNEEKTNKTNMLKENIVINVTLGIVCLVILICLIILVKIRFCKKNNNLNIDDKNLKSIQRIPNPLYKVNLDTNGEYAYIDDMIEI